MRILESQMKSEHGDDLVKWENLINSLHAALNVNENRVVTKNDIFTALFILVSDHSEFEFPSDLYSIEPNFDLFFNELKNYPFEYNRVEIEGSSEGFNIPIYEIKGQIKSKSIIWVLHKL